MKKDYAWRSSSLMLVLCLVTLAVLTSCGGKGNVDGTNLGASASGAPVVAGETRTIGEDEISNLPAWQQDLLADPGWNQPTIPQRADTPMPAPSYEQLLDWQTKAQAAAATAVAGTPRAGADGKSSSWTAGTPTTGLINRGEYNLPFSQGGTVPYGCKDSNGTNGHMKEKKLALEPIPQGANQALTFVEKGVSASNHFNSTGGASNNALCAVYQLWSNKRTADPTQPYSATSPTIAEVSYRADGGPAAGGQPCNTPAAYTVRDFIWWKYNITTFNALPGMNTTALYNILIAPSSNASAQGTSAGPTVGRIQNFYCGSLSSSYGGGAMVTLDSSTNACALFANSVTSQPMLYTNPIYGVLLKRWQDSVLKSMNPPNNNPWNGDFGWPVQGPVPYNNGAQTLTGNGAYYAWGMYFERGFMWWIDYINNTNVPDEAQAYSYTGSNVFCKTASDKYEKLSTIFYGGGASSPLGVSVIVEASLNPDRGAGSPPAGTFYEVGNPASPNPALVLDMHAHGYGGTPRSTDGRYKYYTWAFRDGTIGVTNGTAFDDSTKYLTHSYTVESVYTIRVQVVDNNGTVGYGDSLPVHVGTSGSGGGGPSSGQIWLVKADDATNDGTYGDYPAGFNALKASLTAKGASFVEKTYSASLVTDYQADSVAKVMIFYRGGPGAAGEPAPFTAPFPTAQQDAIKAVLNGSSKKRVLFVGQGQAYTNFAIAPNNTWCKPALGFTCNQIAANSTNAVADVTNWGQNIVGTGRGYDVTISAWRSVGSDTSEYWPLQNYGGTGDIYAGFGNTLSVNAAERYAGSGSSGKVPVCVKVSPARQFTSGCEYDGFDNFSPPWWQVAKPGWKQGLHATTNTGASLGFLPGYVHISHGNDTAPGTTGTGTGKIWCWEFSFSDMTVTSPAGMTKDDLLQNVLSWLDSSLTFTAKTNGGFQEYSGTPEIVSVTPAYWDETNHNYVTGGPTAPWNGTGANTGRFPDQTSTNMYRNSGGLPNAVITTDPGTNNNWINGNDVDFQHAMYAYIDRGVNSTLETGGVSPTWNSTDDSVFYAGVLASDVDLSWARVTPAADPSIMLKEASNNTLNRSPMPVVCGYYQTTGVGSTADDIYANYGTETDAFTATGSNWANSSPLQVECLARWPQTLKYFNWTGPGGQAPNAPDAYLTWQVYPGQGSMIITGPNAGKFVGLNAAWDEYLRNFDVDKSFSLPARTGTAWNRPAFAFQDAATQGRNINFNFRKLQSWNGDMNRDGVLNTKDKFPVRVRLFTDHQLYYSKTVNPGSGWPNHLADPGKDPATTPLASRAPTFLEAGTYVIDKGSPVYKVQILDDNLAPDPGAPGTLTGQGPGTYTAKLQFFIKYGAPNFKVECDTWYNGVFANGPTGNNGQPVNTVLVKDFAQAPNVEGPYNITINVPSNQANGSYTFAVKVTDGNGDTSQFVWPTLVGLFPQALVAEDFESGNLNQWTISGAIGQNYGVNNMNFDWRNVTTSAYNNHSTFYGGPWGGSMTPPQGSRFGCWTGLPGDTNTIGPSVSDRVIELTNAVPCVNGQVYSFSCKTNGTAYPEVTGNSYAYGGITPEISFNGGATWINGSSWSSSAIYNYAVYNTSVWTGGYPFTWVSNAQQSGGQWITRAQSFTATGTSFKIRFHIISYPGLFQSGSVWYPACGPQGIDSIIMQ